jgi:CheY-like chemotaxis protein
MQVVKGHFETLGLLEHTEFVFNGQDAVLKVAELFGKGERISLVLTDFQMPRLNGIQAITKIRNFYQTQRANGKEVMDPEFVFMTAYKTSGFDALVKDLGSDIPVFEKPLQVDQLQEILNEL